MAEIPTNAIVVKNSKDNIKISLDRPNEKYSSGTRIVDLEKKIGDITELETTDKSTIVAAINEAKKSGGSSTTVEVVDNLTTDDSKKALSAKQGKALNENKLNYSLGLKWIQELGERLSKKADTEDVTAELEKKADKSEVDLLTEKSQNLKYYGNADIFPSDASYFYVSDDGHAIVGLTEDGIAQTELVIPYEINGKEITEITESFSFSNCPSLVSLVIPNSVGIMANAFSSCVALKSVVLSEGITAVGTSAFSNCTALTSVILPNSLTYIDNGAFSNCTALRSINIPNSVTDIETTAFNNCSSLISIDIPIGMSHILPGTFNGCTALKSATIPNNVTNIDDTAFSSCPNLTIYCEQGSVADIYTKSKNIPVKYDVVSDIVTKSEMEDNIDLALKPFYLDSQYSQFDGQITSIINGGTTSKSGFSKNYNASQLIGVSKVDIYIPLRDNISTNVTLFVKKTNPWGTVINSASVYADKAGFYSLLIDGSVEVPTTGTICAGYYVDTADALNNTTVYTSSQANNKYMADSSTYSKTLSGDWSSVSNNNSIICIFSYSEMYFPKTEIVKAINDTSVEQDKTLRIVIASDLHFDSITEGLTMGLTNDRFQVMVDSINAEHHKKPIDFVLLNGDLITIHSGNLANKKERMLEFKHKYLDQLEMPYFAIRGNHDGFTDAEWEEMFNQKPQISIETESFVFLMIDVYNTYDSTFNSGADMKYIGAYTQLDWIKEQVEYAKSASKKVICIYHYIDFGVSEEATWLNYLKSEDAIIAQVVGHSHVVYAQNDSTTGKPKIGTGNFGNTSGQASDETHPKENRSGYKIIEVNPDKLVAYHIYPALTYPNWDGEEYISVETQTSSFKIIDLKKNSGADYNLKKLKNNVTVDEIKTDIMERAAVKDADNKFSSQTINGTLTINGNIVQNGEAYETHAEQLYTKKDLIKTREGAVSGLGDGEFTGIEAEKYDGEHNGRLVFDVSGTARVGDVDDEQPLLTREEVSKLVDGQVFVWDGNKLKAVTSDQYVKNTDYASAANAGVVRVQQNYGVNISGVNGTISLACATDAEIKNRSQYYKPIVPSNLDYAVRSVLPLTADAVQSVLAANTEYYLGETAELTFAFPTSGELGQYCFVKFGSGETAANLTVSGDNFAGDIPVPKANTTYEIIATWNGTKWVSSYRGY